MSRVLMGTGTVSGTPLYIKHFKVRVYSIEELCYVLCENAFMLEEADFNDEMVSWIENCCHLDALAAELRGYMVKRASVTDMTVSILSYVHYNTDEEIDKVRNAVYESEHMDRSQRRMNLALHYLEDGELRKAQELYSALETELPAEAKRDRAKVFHNEGVIQARLYRFREAAAFFQKEYDEVRTKDAIMSYMCAMRLCLDDREYVSFMAGNKDAYQFSMELEKRMSDAALLYDASEEKHRVRTLSVYKNEGNRDLYVRGMHDIMREMKEVYRGMVEQDV